MRIRGQHSPLSMLCITMIMCVRRNFFEITTFPNKMVIRLYHMMKKTDHFVWSDADNEAFEELKKRLAESPVLDAPIEKEPLLLYVLANNKAVSVAVVVERKEEGKEYPVQ